MRGAAVVSSWLPKPSPPLCPSGAVGPGSPSGAVGPGSPSGLTFLARLLLGGAAAALHEGGGASSAPPKSRLGALTPPRAALTRARWAPTGRAVLLSFEGSSQVGERGPVRSVRGVQSGR